MLVWDSPTEEYESNPGIYYLIGATNLIQMSCSKESVSGKGHSSNGAPSDNDSSSENTSLRKDS